MEVEHYGHTPGLGNVIVSSLADDDILSVSELCKEVPGLKVTFDSEHVHIHHPLLAEPIVGGKTSTNLYFINEEAVQTLLNLGAESELLMQLEITQAGVDTPALPAAGAVENNQVAPAAAGAMDPKDAPAAAAGVRNIADRLAENSGPNKGLSPEEVNRAFQVRFLHNTLGHPADAQLIDALSNGIILGTHLKARDCLNAQRLFGECLSCIAGKTTRPTYGVSLNETAASIGERVYVDVYYLDVDKNHPTVYGGHSYMLIAVDAFCNMLHVIPLMSKHARDVCKALITLIGCYKEYKHTIKEIHSDQESSVAACATWIGCQEIQLKLGEPHQKCQRIERQVRTIGERKRCIKTASPTEIPQEMDGELTRTAVYYLNDLPNSKNKYQSPRMLFCADHNTQSGKIDLSRRQQIPFGTAVMLDFPQDKEQRARLGVVLGPSDRTYNSNECYCPSTKVIVSRGRGIRPLSVIPENFPWKVREGADPFIAPRRNRTGSKKSKKKTALSNAVAVSSAAQLQPFAASAEDNSTELSLPLGGGLELQQLGKASTAALEVLPLKQPRKAKEVTTPQSIEEMLAISVANRANLKRKHIHDEIEYHKGLKELASLEADTAALKQKAIFYNTMQAQSSTGVDNNREHHTAAAGMPAGAGQLETDKQPTQRLVSEGSQSQRTRNAALKAIKNANLQPEGERKSKRQALRKAEQTFRTIIGAAGTAKAKEFIKAYKLSVKEGLMGEHPRESEEAVNSEINNMLHYKVGHYIKFADIPADKRKNILQTFMFLKHKETPDGLYDRTKARMVGNGATQKTHMYDLVSSSTVSLASVFLLCNLASHYRAKLTTYDIKGAFLHAEFGENDEVTYIRINKEVTALWVKQDPSALPYVDERGTLLLELDKFIYGLKQSPLKFQLHLKGVLNNLGYKQLASDECLFIKHDGNEFSVLSTHVDDIMQVSTSQHLYDELKEGLTTAYKDITTTEEGNAYLGMSIERDKDDYRKIKLSQRGLIDKVLNKYPKDKGDKHRYHSPASDDLFDVNPSGERSTTDGEKREFLSVLMTLMYLARLTRPDILMAVTFLAGRTHCADLRDLRHLERVIRYLEVTRNLGVHINCDNLQLHCSCDASFAVHTPNNNTRGHTGFIVGFGTEMSYLHGRSGKQKTASTSSSDAEIIALCEALKMCVWMRELIRELQITDLKEVIVFQDNKSVIAMCTESTTMKNSKHLLTKLTYIADLVRSGAVAVRYMATGEMTADVLTKPLHGEPFNLHVSNMMGLQWSLQFPGNMTSIEELNMVIVRARKSC